MDTLLDDIATYCIAAGIAETTFGSLAVKDSRFVALLRASRVTGRRMARARQWMLENPPIPQAVRRKSNIDEKSTGAGRGSSTPEFVESGGR